MQGDLEIARSIAPRRIEEVAEELGLLEEELNLYGKFKAKVSLDALERLDNLPKGRYIDVTAITPTPLGEGKTVTTVGLALGLSRLGHKAVACLRQPSMGPVFGIKGGAAGGGRAQVIPMEDLNLHLTGDIHAVQIAHNLLAAIIDNHLHKGNKSGLDPCRIGWRRVLDVSDRSLRNIVIGLGGKTHGIPRETGFDIAAASELMAILALTTGLQDLRQRVGRIVVGSAYDGHPVTAEDLQAAGAVTALLRDAIQPTLMQTTEHTPVFIHSGPFGNIAHGNSSILADQLAVRLADYVVTESGFATDMGAEKFFDIKCRYSGLKPDAAVIVATVRALKVHSGRFNVQAGKPLDGSILAENLDAVRLGAGNLAKHIENVRRFGVPCVVAVNRFASDTDSEVALVEELALTAGAGAAVVSDVYARGGEGGTALAETVVHAANRESDFRFLYPLELPIKDKIATIATEMYGADGVDYEPSAEKDIAWLTQHGFAGLPICMAKTQYSLSDDAKLRGRPSGFRILVHAVRSSVGAGFLVPVCGDINLMPGLPTTPNAAHIDIDESGDIIGLF
ncbi:MAG: formate--tetrahydrofolate ligase [Candidatus Hydrogenedentes bacterium]|nr:formate--tetrahydrofolate ligase [Candidatus Hydrogenedentota bacterium]